jgi:hypothetical protein
MGAVKPVIALLVFGLAATDVAAQEREPTPKAAVADAIADELRLDPAIPASRVQVRVQAYEGGAVWVTNELKVR